MNESFCKSIAAAISSKKVVIYGAGHLGIITLNIVNELGKEVLFFLDRDSDKQKNGFCGYEVKPPEDILYADMSEIIVLIAVGIKKEVEELLIGLGLREGIEFIYTPTLRYETCDAVDPFLGYGRLADINGFKIMGDYDERNQNIICLGGSTTDYSYYEIQSWPAYLSELLQRDNINMNVLNGGVIGYNSSQELLKLIRDGLELHPSLVISFSGVNDLLYCSTPPMLGNKYLYKIWGGDLESMIIDAGAKSIMSSDQLFISYGTESRLNAAEYWYRNEMIMCNICCGFGISFLGILQPSAYSRDIESYSLYSKRAIKTVENREDIKTQFEKAKQLINAGKEKNIVDFTALFDGSEHVYADDVHVFEQGNTIIAEAVYKMIKEKKLLNL